MRGETTRSLGNAVGATSGAVTGWRNGASPRPDMAKRIAEHFGLSVETLLDDSRELPEEYASPLVEDPAEQLVAAPLAVAARQADKLPGTAKERQAAFEIYLRQLRDLRAEAEKIAAGNTPVAVALFEKMLATWLSLDPTSPLDSEAVKDAILAGRRKGFRSAAELSSASSPSHEEKTG